MLHVEPIATTPTLELTPQDVAGLVDELRAYHARYAPLFQRQEQRDWSAQYLRGLLLELPRTSIEPLVLALVGADRDAVRGMQHRPGGTRQRRELGRRGDPAPPLAGSRTGAG